MLGAVMLPCLPGFLYFGLLFTHLLLVPSQVFVEDISEPSSLESSITSTSLRTEHRQLLESAAKLHGASFFPRHYLSSFVLFCFFLLQFGMFCPPVCL
jgi:hypothetical protein